MAKLSSGGQGGTPVEFCGHAAWPESDEELGVGPYSVGFRQKGCVEFGAPRFIEFIPSRQHLQRPAKQRVRILDAGQISRGVT